MDMLREELPKDLPVIYISAVTGFGIQELKDILWEDTGMRKQPISSTNLQKWHSKPSTRKTASPRTCW